MTRCKLPALIALWAISLHLTVFDLHSAKASEEKPTGFTFPLMRNSNSMSTISEKEPISYFSGRHNRSSSFPTTSTTRNATPTLHHTLRANPSQQHLQSALEKNTENTGLIVTQPTLDTITLDFSQSPLNIQKRLPIHLKKKSYLLIVNAANEVSRYVFTSESEDDKTQSYTKEGEDASSLLANCTSLRNYQLKSDYESHENTLYLPFSEIANIIITNLREQHLLPKELLPIIELPLDMADVVLQAVKTTGSASGAESYEHSLVPETDTSTEKQVKDLADRVRSTLILQSNNTYTWPLTEVSNKKIESMGNQESTFHSLVFNAIPSSNDMRLRIKLSGHQQNNNSFLSLFLVIYNKKDSFPAWTNKKSIQLSVIDKASTDGKTQGYSQTYSPDMANSVAYYRRGPETLAIGSKSYAPISLLDNTNYLSNDTIFIRVDILDNP